MSNPEATLPKCIALPKTGGRCAITALSRSALARLCIPSRENGWCPPVISYNIKLPGKRRGTRRIDLESLLAFLESCREGGEGEG
jgi:hypothetical protein